MADRRRGAEKRGGFSAGRAAAAAAAASLLASAAVLLATPADTFWINDCGSKALVAERLLASRGRALAFDRPAAAIDPSGEAFPIAAPFAVVRDGRFVSTYPPAFPALAAPFRALFGRPGLRLPAALGVAASAAGTVWWLAPVFGAPAAGLVGAALALATPLFFYGVTVWEHALTVALAVAAFGLVVRATPARLAAAGAALGAACWLREELALLGLALALATWASTRRAASAGWLAAGAAAPAAGLLALNAAVFGEPLGLHWAASSGAGAAASGLPAAAGFPPWRIAAGLLGSYGRDAAEGAALGGLAVAMPVLGFLAVRRGAARPAAAAALAVGLGAWALGAVRVATAADTLAELARYNGLAVQLPLWALAGVGLARWPTEAAGARRGVHAGLLFVGLVTAFGAAGSGGYGAQAGFGVHWGPRVLLPAFPGLVALAWSALRPPAAAGPSCRRGAGIALALLAAAGLASSAQSARLLAAQKRDAAALQATLRSLPGTFVVTTHPMLAQHLAALWHAKPMLLARDPERLGRVLARLRAAGEREFGFVAPAGAPLLSWNAGLECRLLAARRGERLRYLDLDVQVCQQHGRGRLPRRRAPPAPP